MSKDTGRALRTDATMSHPVISKKFSVWPMRWTLTRFADGMVHIDDNQCMCSILGNEQLGFHLVDFYPDVELFDPYARAAFDTVESDERLTQDEATYCQALFDLFGS